MYVVNRALLHYIHIHACKFFNLQKQNSTSFRVGHDIEKDEADEEEMRSFSPSGQNGTQDGMVQGADNLSYQKEGSGKILRCLS